MNATDRSNEFALWVPILCIGFHFMEEYAFGFPVWAQRALGIESDFADFHMVNLGVSLYLVSAAVIGWRIPRLALSGPAMLLLNALVFHLGTSLLTWSYSPGTLSALLLFVPASLYAFQAARRDGVLTRRLLLESFAIGGMVHVYPLLLVVLR